MNFIDDFLNTLTMYRVVLYGLLIIAFFTIFFGFLNILPYHGLNLTGSLLVLLITCYLVNRSIAYLLQAPTNTESWFITALILYIIMLPLHDAESTFILMFAGTISMASKYVIAINKKHIFNPAAFAAVILSLFHHGAAWWIGSTVMTPIVGIIGLLIVRKVRKFHLFFSFLAVSLITIFIMNLVHNNGGVLVLGQAITSWPILCLGTIMLTEPSTMPSREKLQMIYGAFVGFIMASQVHFGSYGVPAETALVIGNIYSYIVNPNIKLFLHLKRKISLTSDISHFSFPLPQRSLAWIPGQYMEWTLPHTHTDSRGDRRYFTIASSPTEKELMVGVRMSTRGSSYKRKLADMQSADTIVASQIAGDFVLLPDITKKLVFLAGGIGITPFRSMIKYLLDTNQKRDIVLVYTAKTIGDFVYKELFDEAVKKLSIRVHYIAGRTDAHFIQTEIPDYRERLFYISGPPTMVSSSKKLLRSIHILSKQIKTDFFSGY